MGVQRQPNFSRKQPLGIFQPQFGNNFIPVIHYRPWKKNNVGIVIHEQPGLPH
jgi:hypothetical protein